MPQRSIQVALDYGQIDQKLAARQDSKVYTNGLLEATNWRPLPQGGIERRPGFTPDAGGIATGALRILSWEFDEDEWYILALTATSIIFFEVDTSTYALTSIGTQSIAPYWTSITGDEAIELEVALRYDTMLLCHRNLKPLVITRTGLTTFTVQNWDFAMRSDTDVPQTPTFRFTPGSITMQPCDVAGAGITLAQDGDTLYMQWFGTDPATGLAYNPDNIESGSILRYSNIPLKVLTEADANDRVQVEALMDLPRSKRYTLSYDAGSGRAKWLKYETVLCAEDAAEMMIAGWSGNQVDMILVRGEMATIGAALVGAESGNSATLVTDDGLLDMLPTSWWEESVYSGYRGWFGAAAFYQQRLFLGGSWDQPAMVCASKLQQYDNFDMGSGDDTDAIQIILSADNPGQIRSLLPARHLQIFTTTSEHYVAEQANVAITPRTVSIRSASRFGIGQAAPKTFSGQVYFTGLDDQQIRTNSWDDVAQQYNSPPLGFLHQDLLTGISEIHPAYAQDSSPAQYLYVLNTSGELVVVFSVQIQGVNTGFWPWNTTNAIKSLCVLKNQVFLLSNNQVHRVDNSAFCETKSTLRTTSLVANWQEGTTRGRQIRQGKTELDVVDATGLVINGRAAVSPPTTGKVDHWNYGWKRDAQVTIEVEGDHNATILSILQEVSW